MVRCLRILSAMMIALGAVCGWSASNAWSVEAQWDFNDATLTPTFNDHAPLVMDFLLGTSTSDVVQFGTAASFGIPAIAGGDSNVMKMPAFTNMQGLRIRNPGPANGGGADINQYTMVFDLLIPDVTIEYFSFFQTNPDNENDGDFFVNPSAPNGIGISGNYQGSVSSNAWHRIGVTIDLAAANPTMTKYIDGVNVGSQTLGSGLDGRWAIYDDTDVIEDPLGHLYLFTDEDDPAETNAGYVSSFYWTDKVLTDADLTAMGGVDADGPGPVAPALMPDLNMDGVVDIFDVNIVSDNWGGPGPAGDANKDGIVDIFDVNVISDNWTTGVAPVPEPATWALLAVGVAAVTAVGRRRRK